MKTLRHLSLCLLLGAAGYAQALDLKNLEQLTAKATDTTDVTLDGSLLKLASKFLSSEDAGEAKVKKVVAGIKGIYVRSFTFEKEGEYSESDIAAIRNQLHSPEWSRIIAVKSKKDTENADIYIRTGSDAGGLAIICTNPKELTIVNIVGKIDLDELAALGGNFGVPKIDVEKSKPDKPAANKDDD
jgi:hypothetical protein